MSNVFVIPSSGAPETPRVDHSVLAWETVLPSATFSGTEDLEYPYVNMLDNRDNTQWSPQGDVSETTVTWTNSEGVPMNYLAFAVHNGGQCNLTGEVEYTEDGVEWVSAGFFDVKQDDRPVFIVFDDNSSVLSIRVNFVWNGDKLFIGSMFAGFALRMASCPSLGFQPARTASLDRVEQSISEGNNFIIGRRIKRGFGTKGTFNFIPWTDFSWFQSYMNHVFDSGSIYFLWNTAEPEDAFYGRQIAESLIKPTYVTSFHASFSFDFVGYS